MTIFQAVEQLKRKDISCVELVTEYLERIKKLNPQLNAFITVTESKAKECAQKVDTEIAKSCNTEKLFRDKPLLGVPIAHKDIFSTRGVETTASSNILKGYVPPYNSTVVEKLQKAGSIVLGKLNCDAFAHGTTGENSDFGPAKNPYNIAYSPGGSSSGSAVAVSADMAILTTATDTGGSIRGPACYTNTVGIKPTYGRVSRYGVIAMASSLDAVGHITKTVKDSAYVLSVTAGYDENDATTSEVKVQDYISEIDGKIEGLRIGIPQEYFSEGMDGEVVQIAQEAIRIYEKLGAKIVSISLPHTKYALAVYYIIVPSEISSNLARFDGIRFGCKRKSFGDEAKRRIMIGTYTLSAGYYDAYYLKAQKVRTLIIRDFKEAFEKVDVILGPAMPISPPKIGEKVDDPLKLYLMDIVTSPVNLAGLPALSLPAGFNKKGLPLGIQIIGDHFSEKLLYKVGYSFERETKFWERSPKL